MIESLWQTLYGGETRNIDSKIREIPLETCGAYDAWFLTLNSDGKDNRSLKHIYNPPKI